MKIRIARQLSLAVAVVALPLMLATKPVQAEIVHYTFSNFTFNEDGSGSVSGYFDIDNSTESFVNYDIETSDGSGGEGPVYDGYTYDPTDSSASYSAVPGTGFFSFMSDDGTSQLFFHTDGTLGSDTSFNIPYSLERLTTNDTFGGQDILNYRDGDVGTLEVSAAPETSTATSLGLFVAAGIGLVLFGRKRRAVLCDS